VKLWNNTNLCKGSPYSQVTARKGEEFELMLSPSYALFGNETKDEVFFDCVEPPNPLSSVQVPLPATCKYFPANTLSCQQIPITIAISYYACEKGDSYFSISVNDD